MLVAFDTVFGQCSVALLKNGEICHANTVKGNRGQTEIILPMLDELIKQADIKISDVKAWGFNRGPGAFSGIRINTAVVQALAVANDSPCVGVSSLRALAYTAQQENHYPENTRITAVIDARQNEVYVGHYVVKDGKVIAHGENHEMLQAYDSHIDADIVVGDGVALIDTNANKIDAYPTAVHIAELAMHDLAQNGGVNAEHALPVYLRNSNAWKTLAEQKAR